MQLLPKAAQLFGAVLDFIFTENGTINSIELVTHVWIWAFYCYYKKEIISDCQTLLRAGKQ